MGTEVMVCYQPVSDPNRYYARYKDCRDEQGAGEPCTLLAFRKDEFGWPCVWEAPLAVGGFYRKEASEADKKALLSRALLSYREPEGPTPGQLALERYRDSLWEAVWEDFTPRGIIKKV